MTIVNSTVAVALATKPAFNTNCGENFLHGHVACRSKSALKITDEVTDWERLASAELQNWKERSANNKGEIIN
jgi:hypothetical protein